MLIRPEYPIELKWSLEYLDLLTASKVLNILRTYFDQ